ncbi:LytR family transcriptional regulator [Cohnella endophytica]|uniref:LytR family transcriptional regulator n=1 Tax=Cohnella endophytica TaxID=2419778 RepID=A0A494XT87_9BACL|nr:LCP family protein [Cohnella endophytica]RKP51334.1 LytR family transcriptional regulator [Cohnella endophytica]
MRKYRRLKVILISSFMVLIVAAGVIYANRGALSALGYDIFLSDKVEASFADSYKPLTDRPVGDEANANVVKDPFSMLLMGVDARAQERGRSDTLIYTVVRPKDGKVLMVSIPRDTYAEIVGKDKKDKITHAYAFGGPEMAVNSVEKLLDAKVDHYASINFQGFVKVVDTLGGIPLPIGKDIVNKGADHEKFTVKANKDSYSGVEALNYVRYREDAGGDMSRTERNRAFLEALVHKTSSLQQWNKIPEILGIVGDNFKTDIAPSSMSDLAKQFLQVGHEIKSYTLKGEGKRMGDQNLWYYLADETDLAAVKSTIATWMNPETPESELVVPGEKDQTTQGGSTSNNNAA